MTDRRVSKRLKKLERYGLFLLLLLLICSFIADRNRADETARPWYVKAYVQKYRYLATELNQETGIPLPIIYAVAGLESNWGRSELARQANNHFGLKVKEGWRGHQYCKDTQEFSQSTGFREEWACFRKYPLIRRSYLDFGAFLAGDDRYAHLFLLPESDVVGWAEGLQAAGYATDPEYARKLRGIIWRYRLARPE